MAYKDELRKERRMKNFLRFLAYFIPLCILLYVVYLNVLPFGYSKEYTINIDNDGKVYSSSSEVYLEDLKGNKIEKLDSLYGTVNLVVKPRAVLREASVDVSVTGDNVYLGVEPSISSYDYEFDFGSGIPNELIGNATFDSSRKCVYFDGNSKLYLPNSSDKFENGSFVVYAEWIPEMINETRQEIVGHYNWEIWQYEDKIRAVIATKFSDIEKFHAVEYPISEDFFNQKHDVLFVYSSNEFIGLFVNNDFGKFTMLNNETIWGEYNGERDLSFGSSEHGTAIPFNGCVSKVKIGQKFMFNQMNSFYINKNALIPIFGDGKISSVNIKLEKL